MILKQYKRWIKRLSPEKKLRLYLQYYISKRKGMGKPWKYLLDPDRVHLMRGRKFGPEWREKKRKELYSMF